MKKRHLYYLVLIIMCVSALVFFWFLRVKGNPEKEHLNKIWVLENKDSIGHPFSFYINYTGGNLISGNLQIGQPALPDLFVYDEEPSKYLIPFSGNVKGNIAACPFGKGTDKAGILTIYFLEDGTLEASITWTNGMNLYEGVRSAELYRFRPYHISDFIDVQEKQTIIETDLNDWGHVYLRAVAGRAPELFMTDEEGNIFYIFWNTITGTEITQVKVEDMNGDGLKDISFLMEPLNNTNSGIEIWRKYYQREDGLFVLCHDTDEDSNLSD